MLIDIDFFKLWNKMAPFIKNLFFNLIEKLSYSKINCTPRISLSFDFPIIIYWKNKLALFKSLLRTLISFSSYVKVYWRSLNFVSTKSFLLIIFFLSSSRNAIMDMKFNFYTSSSPFLLLSNTVWFCLFSISF